MICNTFRLRRQRSGAFSILTVFLLATLGGCQNANDGRMAISGTITLRGEALDEGVIEFMPIANAESGGPATQSGAAIANGAYNVPRDSGLVAGTYKVLITSGDGKTPADGGLPGPTGNIVSVDRIPPEYNVNSKQKVRVTPEGPNVFDFNIP